MVIFHFCFDLRYFNLVDWNVPNGDGWWQFRYFILTLFIGAMGASLWVTEFRGRRSGALLRRSLVLGAAAGAISLMSLVVFPQSWIYFGILHFMFAASLICLPLAGKPILAAVLGAVVIALSLAGLLSPLWPFQYIDRFLPAYTEDFVPLFPWLGVAFLGIAAGALAHRGAQQFTLSNMISRALAPLAFAGRHSLTIYLLHQPVLFALIYLFLML